MFNKKRCTNGTNKDWRNFILCQSTSRIQSSQIKIIWFYWNVQQLPSGTLTEISAPFCYVWNLETWLHGLHFNNFPILPIYPVYMYHVYWLFFFPGLRCLTSSQRCIRLVEKMWSIIIKWLELNKLIIDILFIDPAPIPTQVHKAPHPTL